MEYDRENILLLYEARLSPESEPRLRLLILKQGNAVFFRTNETRRDPDGPDLFVSVSDDIMDIVRLALSQEKLYRLGSIESPKVRTGFVHTYDFFFAGEGHMVAYQAVNIEDVLGRKDCPNASYLYSVLGWLGEALIPQGVPMACFLPAWERSEQVAIDTEKRPTDTFVLYDFLAAENQRMLDEPKENVRLERYAFSKYTDGSVTFDFQAGWIGGTGHWDGAGNSFPLPKEWFTGSYPEFCRKLTERYPANTYGFCKEELSIFPGLKKFLGF